MTPEQDDREVIVECVVEELTFFRTYIAQVIDNRDEDGLGRVLVTVPELGFNTAEHAILCSPRANNSISVPPIGAYIEIRFMGADSSRPVYSSRAGEITGNIPKSFDGDPDTHVLFESPADAGDNIVFNKNRILVIFKGKDFAVKFEELKAAFDQLVSDFNLHVHTSAGSGSPSSVPTQTTSADMSNAKVDKIKL